MHPAEDAEGDRDQGSDDDRDQQLRWRSDQGRGSGRSSSVPRGSWRRIVLAAARHGRPDWVCGRVRGRAGLGPWTGHFPSTRRAKPARASSAAAERPRTLTRVSEEPPPSTALPSHVPEPAARCATAGPGGWATSGSRWRCTCSSRWSARPSCWPCRTPPTRRPGRSSSSVALPWIGLAGWPVLATRTKGRGRRPRPAPARPARGTWSSGRSPASEASLLAAVVAALIEQRPGLRRSSRRSGSSPTTSPTPRPGRSCVLALFAGIGAPICEEIAFRGLLYGSSGEARLVGRPSGRRDGGGLRGLPPRAGAVPRAAGHRARARLGARPSPARPGRASPRTWRTTCRAPSRCSCWPSADGPCLRWAR